MIIRILALAAGITAATLVCGCCSSSGNARGLGASVGLSLPPLSEVFTGPPRPVCIPEGACVAAYGDGWKVLNCGESEEPQPMVQMPASTLERVLRVQPDRVDPEPQAVGEGKLIRRIVTTYEGGIPNAEDAVPTAASDDCP